MQWNLNVQRELFAGSVFTIGYTGSHAVKLITLRENNTAIPQILPDGRKFIPEGTPRRNPNFSSLFLFQAEASSFYHSLQLSLNKRYGDTPIGPFQFQASYTLSKSIDEQSSDLGGRFSNAPAGIQDVDNIKGDRGLSNFDVRHNFTLNYVYDIPLGIGATGFAKIASGWQINGITTIASGIPFNVFLGFNNSRNQGVTFRRSDRPNLKPGLSNNPTDGFKTVEQWFDKDVFELGPGGFYGNLGRNTVIGPGFVTFDFSLVKNTPISSISENFNVQFRAEFFNLFNRANFAAPKNSAGGTGGVIIFNEPGPGEDPKLEPPLGTAGRIFSTVSTSRQIQFAFRILW